MQNLSYFISSLIVDPNDQVFLNGCDPNDQVFLKPAMLTGAMLVPLKTSLIKKLWFLGVATSSEHSWFGLDFGYVVKY